MMQTERFEASWHPVTAAQNLSIKRGRKEDDGTSFWDWIEQDQIEVTRPFPALAAAGRYAKACVKNDCFGQVNICKQVFNEDDNLWEDVAMWWVFHDTKLKDLNPDSPDVDDRSLLTGDDNG